MTISNKYNADFSVLTIKVVRYAHVIWISKKMMENVFSINFQGSTVVKSRSISSNDPVHCRTHDLGVEHGQGWRFESGAAN
jgi:hypothetical protein